MFRDASAPVTPATTVSEPSLSPAEARITLTLNEIPLAEALRYIATQAGLKVKVEPYAISIIPISEQSERPAHERVSCAAGIYQRIPERQRLVPEPAGEWQRSGARRGNGQGHAGVDRRPLASEPRRSQGVSGESGSFICGPRFERKLSSANQPAHRAKHGRQPGARRCHRRAGQCLRTKAGRDRGQVR